MQAKRGRCKAAGSVRGAGGAAEELAGRGVRTGGAPGVSISSTLNGVEEREEEGDVGPSFKCRAPAEAGPRLQQRYRFDAAHASALTSLAIRAPRAAAAAKSRH